MNLILSPAFLVFAHLILSTVGYTSGRDNDDVELVDPYDFSYDESTQTNKPTDDWKKKLKGQCTPELKAECKRCGYHDSKKTDDSEVTEEIDENLCPSSDFLVIHFARSLLKQSDSQDMVITLGGHEKEKLEKYVKEKKHSAGEIMDMLIASLVPLPDSNEVIHDLKYSNNGITKNKIIIGLLLLASSACIFAMVLNCQFSLIRVTCAIVFTVFFMSTILSYMFLYEKAVAKRMADDVQRKAFNDACHSPEDASLFTNFGSFFKRFVTNEDRECEKFFEDHQIDIFVEVLPIDAITHTFGSVANDLAEIFGSSSAKFMSTFFGRLPYLMWIPGYAALLIAVAAILAVYWYCRRPQVIIREIRERPLEIRDEQRPERIQDVAYRHPAIRERGDSGGKRPSQSENDGEERHRSGRRPDRSKDESEECHHREKRPDRSKDDSEECHHSVKMPDQVEPANRGGTSGVMGGRVKDLERHQIRQDSDESCQNIEDSDDSEDDLNRGNKQGKGDLCEQRDETFLRKESLSDDNDFEVISDDN